MRSFDFEKEYSKLLTPDIVSYIAQIHEYRGRYSADNVQKELLSELLEIARIQSTEASNRIEGIITTDDRLKKIVREKTLPKTRSEKEIAGYRDVLATIHENYEYIPVSSNMILQLHRDLYKFSGNGYGGNFKSVDNVIAEELPDGTKRVRFQPVPAWETAETVNDLCNAFKDAVNKQFMDILLLLPMFILDFLCIHPFNDGNGRMSRLLTTLLLYRSGFYVGKYISLEAKIAKNKDLYYEVLGKAQNGWHEGEEDVVPFIKYLLGTILAAYKDFEDRFEIIGEKLPALEMVRKATKNKIGKFSKQDIRELCPSLSISSIEGSLRTLVKEGELMRGGSGKATYYVRLM